MKKINVLVICLLIVIVVASVGGIFTSPAVNSLWYETVKPSITPPNYIFPVAWTIIFFLIALAMYFVWINANKKQKKTIAVVFSINFFFNILWSVLYFGMKNALLAFFDVILLWVSILVMIAALWKIDKKASYLLVPYFLWVTFASVLNFLSIK